MKITFDSVLLFSMENSYAVRSAYSMLWSYKNMHNSNIDKRYSIIKILNISTLY